MLKNLYTLERAPLRLPVWQSIVDDLGSPSARRLAKTLAVSERTVYRWNQTGYAPRIACMALFWLTRWGVSHIETQAFNDASMASQLANALRQENERLRAQVAHLQQLGHYGSANSPLIGGSK